MTTRQSMQKFSMALMTSTLLLSPVAWAANDSVTSKTVSDTASESASGTASDIGLPEKTEKCDGSKSCKKANCECKSKKHCKHCEGMDHHHHDQTASKATGKTTDKSNDKPANAQAPESK